MKRIVSVLAVICICIISHAQPQPQVGNVAAEIKLPNAKGAVVTLSSLKGKVVIVDFWASWCGPCRKSVPELKALYTNYKAKGFEIYGVSVDEEKSEWLKAVKEDGISWLQVNDPRGDAAAQWNVNYLPNTYLLDKTGKIIAINPTHQELGTLLQKLLH